MQHLLKFNCQNKLSSDNNIVIILHNININVCVDIMEVHV